MSSWNWYWLGWAAVTLISFGVAEFIAIKNAAKGDTLSESVWMLLKTGWRVPFTILFLGTFGWLIPHFFMGW